MTAPDLLVCPSCGSGKATTRQNASFSGVEVLQCQGRFFVNCGTCGCRGSSEKTETEAIAAWNTRATPAPAAMTLTAVELDAALDAIRVEGPEPPPLLHEMDAAMDVPTEAQIDAALDAVQGYMREHQAYFGVGWREFRPEDLAHVRASMKAGLVAALRAGGDA